MADEPAATGRTRILQVARELFSTRGFSDVSMQQIADAAGLRKASIYHHFPSKIDLFVASVWAETEEMFAQAEAALASTSELVPQLRAVARVWVDTIGGPRGQRLRDVQEYTPIAEYRKFERRYEEYTALIADIFARATGAGLLRDVDPMTAARFFLDLVAAWVFRAYYDPVAAAMDADDAIQMLLDLLFFGIAAPTVAPSDLFPDLHGTR